MKLYSIVLTIVFGLSSVAFVNFDNTSIANSNKQSTFIKAVKRVVQKRYPANFTNSTVRKLNKSQVVKWMKVNSKKNRKLQARNIEIINQILSQKAFEIYLIENVEVKSCPITEMVFARVSAENRTNFDFSTYFVSNDDFGECPMDPDPGEEEKVCTNTWGENPPANSFQTAGSFGLGADTNCVCMSESVTGDNCQDSGSCGSC